MSNDLRRVEMNFLLMFTKVGEQRLASLFHTITQRYRMMGNLSSPIGGFWGHPGMPLTARRERKRMEMYLWEVDTVQTCKWTCEKSCEKDLFPSIFPGYSSVIKTYLLKGQLGNCSCLGKTKKHGYDKQLAS